MLRPLWRCLLLRRGWPDAAGDGVRVTRGHTSRQTLAVADHYVAEAWGCDHRGNSAGQFRLGACAWRCDGSRVLGVSSSAFVAAKRMVRSLGPSTWDPALGPRGRGQSVQSSGTTNAVSG